MNYFFLKSLIIITLLPCSSIFAAAGRDLTTITTIQGCAGQGVTCNFASNATGDVKDIAINKTTPVYNVGPIKTTQTLSITFPLMDRQKVFTLILTQPFSSEPIDQAMVGVPMEVLLVTSAPDTEVLKTDLLTVAMVKVYRRMHDEQLWTEIATITSNANITELLPVTLIINPDGRAEFFHQGQTKALYFGEAIVGSHPSNISYVPGIR
jgi:hypothetical protein